MRPPLWRQTIAEFDLCGKSASSTGFTRIRRCAFEKASMTMTSRPGDVRSLLLEVTDRIGSLPDRSVAALRRLRSEYSRRLRDIDPQSILLLSSELRDARVVHRF